MFNELEAPDPGWMGWWKRSPKKETLVGNVGSKENNNDTKIKATELKVNRHDSTRNGKVC